ncbi:MAG TPA: molecular chaperone DnaJ [Acidimicrobiia bacterium]|nr:molecular chaperone DnaJ [Acidimicrobiia bacterium]
MTTTPMQDFYEILGVTRSATDDEIKKAYRALARQYHPDANPGDADAEARFKEVSVAYETLRDPEKRRRYDMFGAEGLGQAAGFGGGDFGLNDLFDAFFGGDAFGRARGSAGPPRGQDAETAMELTLEEAAFGVTRTLEITMPVECDTCGGDGAAEGTHAETCPTCEGRGEVRQMRRSILGQLVTAGPCPQCSGLGTIVPNPCPTCRGEGRHRGTRSLDVEVPPGIDDGQRLRLAGRGPAAPRGGGAGDLYVGVRMRRDPRFERRGDDLYRLQRVALTQAALGAEVEIETLDGPEVVIVEPGTQPGAVQRIRGKGMPSLRTGRRGDILVELDVEVPTDLTGDQAELLAQFAALRGEEVSPPKDHGLFSRIKSAFQ